MNDAEIAKELALDLLEHGDVRLGRDKTFDRFPAFFEHGKPGRTRLDS